MYAIQGGAHVGRVVWSRIVDVRLGVVAVPLRGRGEHKGALIGGGMQRRVPDSAAVYERKHRGIRRREQTGCAAGVDVACDSHVALPCGDAAKLSSFA